MPSLPDPAGSRAVLLGTGHFDRPDLPEISAIRNNLSALAEALRSERVWGLSREHCVLVEDPSTNVGMLDPIATAAGEATDTLLLYYAGHGLVDSKRGDLHLTLTTTNAQRIYTAVPYDVIRDILLDSRAACRIVILDCCYSGRALGTMADPATTVVDEVSAEGTYILAAASENKVALAPPGEPFTAFTAELLDIFQRGVEGAGELLDLDTIYRRIQGNLRGRSRPVPQKRDRNTAGQTPLVQNQAHPTIIERNASRREFLQVNAGVAEVTHAMLEQLGSLAPAERTEAAHALGWLDNAEQPVLEQLYTVADHDTDPRVRQSAKNALLRLGEAGRFGIVRIPAGEFRMGTSDRQRAYLRHHYGMEGSWTYSESPERTVSLPEFYIDRTLVTNAQFAEFTQATGYRTVAETLGSGHIKLPGSDNVSEVEGVNWTRPAGAGSTWRDVPDHPVVLLASQDAVAYATWVGKRLPTEAEWEKAARGTDGRLWPWGDTWEDGRCNTADFHVRRTGGGVRAQWWRSFSQLKDAPLTTPVGAFPQGASPYGLLDCAGNACERTSNWYEAYPDAWESSQQYGTTYHVLRGGAFHHGPELARTAARDFAHPLFRTFHDGFRCVTDLAAETDR
ncbi:SUMF1/EgtB/PvdO family nonheme iron enzyme [Streptomyces sp. NPDC050610]|uniref:caspase, EACC1-associated type n=1 Tax=Streptomyces sp. NPDC050610 TaxID=3157097 RepID=UPI00341ADD67